MKTCTQCKRELTLDSYSPTHKNGSKFHTACKDCRASNARAHRKVYPETYRGYEYKKKYKITLEIYDKKLAEQNGVCVICGGVNSDRSLQVDHNHDCCPGESTCGNCLRGLLCGLCNTGLGAFKNDPNLLLTAIKYLEENKGSPWS